MGYWNKISLYPPLEWPKVIWYSLLSIGLNRLSKQFRRNYEVIREMDHRGFTFKRMKSDVRVTLFTWSPITLILKRNSSDLQVFNQIFIEKEYEVLFDFLKSKNIVPTSMIDVGANIGLFSILFHHHFPSSAIFALEPSIQTFERMQKNIEMNQISMQLIPKGLWHSPGKLQGDFSFRDGEDWSFRLKGDTTDHGDIEVIDMASLMQELRLTNVEVVKMDIEGGEAAVFENPDKVDQWLPHLHVVAVEIHDEFNCRENIMKAFSRNHFEVVMNSNLTIAINKKWPRT